MMQDRTCKRNAVSEFKSLHSHPAEPAGRKRILRFIPRVTRRVETKWQLKAALFGLVLLSTLGLVTFTTNASHRRRLVAHHTPKELGEISKRGDNATPGEDAILKDEMRFMKEALAAQAGNKPGSNRKRRKAVANVTIPKLRNACSEPNRPSPESRKFSQRQRSSSVRGERFRLVKSIPQAAHWNGTRLPGYTPAKDEGAKKDWSSNMTPQEIQQRSEWENSRNLQKDVKTEAAEMQRQLDSLKSAKEQELLEKKKREKYFRNGTWKVLTHELQIREGITGKFAENVVCRAPKGAELYVCGGRYREGEVLLRVDYKIEKDGQALPLEKHGWINATREGKSVGITIARNRAAANPTPFKPL